MRTNKKFFLTLILSLGIANTGFATPNIQYWQTKNGASVYFVESPELPMVDIQVVFDAGSARDENKPGVSLMTNGMLAEGAGAFNANEIAEEFESVGANFGNDSQRDMSVFTLRTLSDKPLLDKATRMFATVLSAPTFPEKAFQRERSRLLISLQQNKQSPGTISSETFYEQVFKGHPYASLPEGSIDSVEKLTIQDVRDFYVRYMNARNATVAIVGALNRNQAEDLAEKIVGKLNPGRVAAPLPEVEDLNAGSVKRIEFPSSQSHIMIGQAGVTRKDPDYFALYLGNHIFGGSGLVSILSDEIREKRGLAYSSYSYFAPMRQKGPFVMGMQTQNDQVDEALKVMNEVLNDYVKNGPTEAQLEAAKKNLTGGFALKVASNKSIVGYLGVIGFYKLPLNYLDTFIPKIQAITRAQIQDAYQRRVKPDKLFTVVVGGAAASEKEKN
ncbi:MAG: insulinase family protein [Gammaproteobacteria bacterium]|nr:insulinase family protein [Gammaproteobacteria bacterium]